MSTEHPRTPHSGAPGDEPLDEWARTALRAAAATIDVDPSVPLPESPRTRSMWLAPLAAAAVVVLCVGVPVWLLGSDRVADDPSANTSDRSDALPAARPVDTTGAVPWSDRTDAKKWTPRPGNGPFGDVDPVRWPGLAAELTVPSAADPNSDLVYVVTLRNHGDAAVDLGPCPAFRQTISADPDLNLGPLAEYTGRLSCDDVGPIPPGRTQRFVMKVHLPGNLPGSEVSLAWQLVDGPGQDAQEWLPVGQDPVKRAWATRTPLPNCGHHDRTKLDHLTSESDAEAIQEGIACLNRGLDSGAGGEFITTTTTVEGAPITRYSRVIPGGRVEIYYDSTQDSLGSQAWEYFSCGAVSEVETVHYAGC